MGPFTLDGHGGHGTCFFCFFFGGLAGTGTSVRNSGKWKRVLWVLWRNFKKSTKFQIDAAKTASFYGVATWAFRQHFTNIARIKIRKNPFEKLRCLDREVTEILVLEIWWYEEARVENPLIGSQSKICRFQDRVEVAQRNVPFEFRNVLVFERKTLQAARATAQAARTGGPGKQWRQQAASALWN